MSLAEKIPGATLDPWLLIEMPDGDRLLFGYAERHPLTGGLSWLRSSPVVELDEAAGRARTASGRIYVLGRRTSVDRLESEEGRAALLLLVLKPEGLLASDPLEDDATGAWLIARKWGRHLGIDAPPREKPEAVRCFLDKYADLYAALRAGRKPS